LNQPGGRSPEAKGTSLHSEPAVCAGQSVQADKEVFVELGRVSGTVVATVKEPKLLGAKLLVVELLDLEAQPTANSVVSVDTVGAGHGDVVLVDRGSSARQADKMESVPTDACVIAIVDALEVSGQVRYKK